MVLSTASVETLVRCWVVEFLDARGEVPVPVRLPHSKCLVLRFLPESGEVKQMCVRTHSSHLGIADVSCVAVMPQ